MKNIFTDELMNGPIDILLKTYNEHVENIDNIKLGDEDINILKNVKKEITDILWRASDYYHYKKCVDYNTYLDRYSLKYKFNADILDVSIKVKSEYCDGDGNCSETYLGTCNMSITKDIYTLCEYEFLQYFKNDYEKSIDNDRKIEKLKEEKSKLESLKKELSFI